MGFLFPIPASLIGPVSSGLKFGATRTTTDPPHPHGGVDLAWGQVGAPVLAAAAGVVSASNAITGDGRPWGIYIDHGDGWQTRYLHLADDGSAIVKGASVVAGEKIGTVGQLASGPHLHFELLRNGIRIDPEPMLESSAGGNFLVMAVAGVAAYYLWRYWRGY